MKGVHIQISQFIYVKVEVPQQYKVGHVCDIYLYKTNKFIYKDKEGYLLLPVD